MALNNTSYENYTIPFGWENKILECELVPKTCWYSNVRDHVSQSQWDKIRVWCYARADFRCEICGNTGLNQGRKHRCEAHEIWHYDDETKVQTLTGLISLCPRCHEVKHYGRAIILNNDKRARQHLKFINKSWNWHQVFSHCEKALVQYEERSRHEWTLNMDWLNTTFNLNVKIHRENKKDE